MADRKVITNASGQPSELATADAADVGGGLVVAEAGPTGTPTAGKVRIYAKADGRLYAKDDTGTENALTAGSGASQDTTTGALIATFHTTV